MNTLLRATQRTALSSYVTNGVSTGLGLLLISALFHVFLGPAAAAAGTVGVIVASPPDQPAPRRGKLTHMLPAPVIGTPLFFAVQMLHQSPIPLWLLLVSASFVAFLGAAWGKRGLPVSAAVMFAMLFSLATPPPADLGEAWLHTMWFAMGAVGYALWATLANSVLNQRYRVLALTDSLFAVAHLMRTQARQFTAPREQDGERLARLMKQQATLADQLQGARNMLLESPRTRKRQQLAGMLMQILDMRDHLVACALDLDAVRARPEHDELVHALGGEIQGLADTLEGIADALLLGREPPPLASPRPAIAVKAAQAMAAGHEDWRSNPSQPLAGALSRRVGYLHDEAGRLVALARREIEPDLEVVRVAWHTFVSPTSWSLRPFMAMWRWDAPPLRHAIRAALAIGAGQGLSMVLPWGSHDYWILLTITAVLRGSLAQTLERRNARVAGTLLGCVVAGALLFARPPALFLLFAVTVAQAVAHAFAVRRYLVTAFAATVLSLVQAHLMHGSTTPTFDAIERLADTLLGVLIAWIFSYVLPSWERTQLGSLVARTLAAQARHAQLALGLGQLRAVDNEAELGWRLARREAYDSVSALVQSIQRTVFEPRAVRPRLAPLERMLAHSYQLLAQLTAVKTMLLLRRERLDIERLQRPLQQATLAIASALTGNATTAVPVAPEDDVPPMLEVPKPAEHDLTPFVLRRLQLSIGIAQQLRAEAVRALQQPADAVSHEDRAQSRA